MRQSKRAMAGAVLAVTALSGCMMQDIGTGAVSRLLQALPDGAPAMPWATETAAPAESADGAPSAVIGDLASRQSVLTSGSAYHYSCIFCLI